MHQVSKTLYANVKDVSDCLNLSKVGKGLLRVLECGRHGLFHHLLAVNARNCHLASVKQG